MSERRKKPNISKNQARRLFREAFENGSVSLTKHARERMKQHNVTTNDLLSLARSGIVRSEAEEDINTGLLKYRIESNSLELKAVFIPQDRKVRILTVIVS